MNDDENALVGAMFVIIVLMMGCLAGLAIARLSSLWLG